jgi:hypothetical protein
MLLRSVFVVVPCGALSLLLLALPGCGTEEDPVPGEDTGLDAAEDSGAPGDAEADVEEPGPDGSMDADQDGGPPDVPPPLPDGMTDTGSGLDGGDDSDADALDACLMACGVGCPAPEFQPCASDGARYCNTCIIACYGLTEAAPSVCEGGTGDLCPAPTEGEAVVWRALVLPETCPPRDGFAGSGLLPERIYTEEAALVLDAGCDPGTTLGVDFATERVFVAVIFNNPVLEVQDVRRVGEEDGLTVYLTTEVYCGGARPPDSSVLVVLPAGDAPVLESVCQRGVCVGPPRP